MNSQETLFGDFGWLKVKFFKIIKLLVLTYLHMLKYTYTTIKRNYIELFI